MTVYATRQDALDLYGESAVVVAGDPEGTGSLATNPLDSALVRASQDIDGYYLRVGQVPPATLGEAPPWLTPACVDIAIYMASADAGSGTEEKLRRADYWRKRLMDAFPVVDGEGHPTVASSRMGVTLEAGDRVFTRTTMGGLL